MIYPAYLPCPSMVGQSQSGGRTFLRSTFEYGTRQRPMYCSDYMYSCKFIMKTASQMKQWKDFYYNKLNNGVSIFSADWRVEGIDGMKEFRFAQMYSVTPITSEIYEVTAKFQMTTKIKDL